MCRWYFILHWLIWLLIRRLQYTTHLLRMAFNAFSFLWSLFYRWHTFRFNYFICFTCINVLPTCLVLKNSTEVLRSLAPGVTDDCELPCITELTSSVRVTSALNPWVVSPELSVLLWHVSQMTRPTKKVKLEIFSHYS